MQFRVTPAGAHPKVSGGLCCTVSHTEQPAQSSHQCTLTTGTCTPGVCRGADVFQCLESLFLLLLGFGIFQAILIDPLTLSTSIL